MAITINYQKNTKLRVTNYSNLYNKLSKLVLKKLKLKGSYEVSVLIVDNKKIKQLNAKFRNKNYPTDVLSFPYLTSKEIKSHKVSANPKLLGDIVISVQKAKSQSIEFNHSLKREMSFLFVHGLLHLLGYDHENKKMEKVMFTLQELILNQAEIRRQS